MRKYTNYTLAVEYDDTCCFESYKEAFSAYHKADGHATLYGETEQGDIETIFAK